MSSTLTHAYATLDDLREQLSDLQRKALSERMLIRALNAASRAVDNWTGRWFYTSGVSETRLVKVPADCGYDDLWLPFDIATSTGLAIATDDAGDGSYSTTFDATDYRLWPYDANQAGSPYGAWWKLENTGRLRFDVRGARGVLPLQITAPLGFGWSFIPDPVEQATLLKAAQLFKRKDSPYGVEQFGDIAAVTITRKDGDVVELLAPYVRDVAMVG